MQKWQKRSRATLPRLRARKSRSNINKKMKTWTLKEEIRSPQSKCRRSVKYRLAKITQFKWWLRTHYVSWSLYKIISLDFGHKSLPNCCKWSTRLHRLLKKWGKFQVKLQDRISKACSRWDRIAEDWRRYRSISKNCYTYWRNWNQERTANNKLFENIKSCMTKHWGSFRRPLRYWTSSAQSKQIKTWMICMRKFCNSRKGWLILMSNFRK